MRRFGPLVGLLVGGAVGALVTYQLFGRLPPQSVSLSSASASAGPTEAGSATSSRPWGKLELSNVTLQPSLSVVKAEYCSSGPVTWRFRGFSMEQLNALADSAKLTGGAREEFLGHARCGFADDGCVVSPSPAFVRSLVPETRRTIYRVLASFDDNPQSIPFTWRRSELADWAKGAQLPDATFAKLQQLLYFEHLETPVLHEAKRRDVEIGVFADERVLCSELEPDQRIGLARALVRTRSILAKVRIEPNANVQELAAYWGRGGRSVMISPMLEAAAASPEGASPSIVNLLPPLARAKLNSYPTPGEPAYNCWWTSLNFFEPTPNNALVSEPAALEALARDYERTGVDDLRFGDALVLRNGRGKAIHIASYIADDIVFTKNGASPGRPWSLSTFDDLMVVYHSARSLEIYRRKGAAR